MNIAILCSSIIILRAQHADRRFRAAIAKTRFRKFHSEVAANVDYRVSLIHLRIFQVTLCEHDHCIPADFKYFFEFGTENKNGTNLDLDSIKIILVRKI